MADVRSDQGESDLMYEVPGSRLRQLRKAEAEVERLRKALREIEAHVNAVLQTPGMPFSSGLIQAAIRLALDEGEAQ